MRHHAPKPATPPRLPAFNDALSHANHAPHPALPTHAFTLSGKAKLGSIYKKASYEVKAERAAASAILAARRILQCLAQSVANSEGERKKLALKNFQNELKFCSADEFKDLCAEMETIAKGDSSSGAESANGGGSKME